MKLLEELERELRKNEYYLRQINRFYSLYQNSKYEKYYKLIEQIKQQEAP